MESVNSLFRDPIQFDSNAEDGHVLVPDPFPEVINVTLLTSGMSAGDNISSQITVLVNAKTLGKHVYCSDSITNESIVIKGPSKFVMLYSNDVESAIHHPTGEPSQPDIFIYNFTHGIGSYSATLKWLVTNSPVVYYSITLYCNAIVLLKITTTRTEQCMQNLNYTANCSASVTAINCIGDESTSVINFNEGRVY